MRPFNAQGKYARHEFFKQCKRMQLFHPYLGPDIISSKVLDHKCSPKAKAGTGGFNITKADKKGSHK